MPIDTITFEPQPDGTLIKTTVSVIPKNGIDFEVQRLKELTADLERRLPADADEIVEVQATVVAYKGELAKLPSAIDDPADLGPAVLAVP